MTRNEWKAWLGAVSRVLLAYALIFAQSAWAGQNQQSKPNTASPEKAGEQSSGERQGSPATTAKTLIEEAQGATARSATAENKRPGGGPHEGITVHGHWSIEIRNPDGSLVRHVEFENSLDPGFSLTNPTAGGAPLVVAGGAAYLSAVLSGQWASPFAANGSMPGGSAWEIMLVGASGLSNLETTTNAACMPNPGGTPIGACVIAQAAACPAAAIAGIACNLSVTPLGTSPNFTGIQLSGSVAATQNGQIATVGTLLSVQCPPSVPNCTPSSMIGASFTSSTNFPGAPISIVAGQTIAVTVNISFS
jgi:hypothetical protein